MPALGLIYEPPTDDWPTPRAWVAVKDYAVLAAGGPVLAAECASLAVVALAARAPAGAGRVVGRRLRVWSVFAAALGGGEARIRLNQAK